MGVSTGTSDVVNCNKGLSSLLLVNSLGMVDLLQQRPSPLKLAGCVHVGGWAEAEGLTGWVAGVRLVAGPFGTLWLKGILQGRCMDGAEEVRGAGGFGRLLKGEGWLDGPAGGGGLLSLWWGGRCVNVHSWLLWQGY